MKDFIYVLAAGFYTTLVLYVLSELYYTQTYWRLVLRKSRNRRWNYILWLERVVLVILGLAVTVLTIYRT